MARPHFPGPVSLSQRFPSLAGTHDFLRSSQVRQDSNESSFNLQGYGKDQKEDTIESTVFDLHAQNDYYKQPDKYIRLSIVKPREYKKQ